MNENHWAVVLAGGDGTRLRPLTRQMFGDERPKQFCPVLGGATLLSSTRERLARILPPERTLYLLVKAHHIYYDAELRDVPASRRIIQPSNRGTSAAIVYGLLRTSLIDRDAVIGFFPTDHHYANEEAFVEAAQKAYRLARRSPRSLILVTADPTGPEPEYGWIEPHASRADRRGRRLCRVSRFHEKPSQPLARRLLKAGGLWNTFVMVGRAAAFLDIIGQTIPQTLRRLSTLVEHALPDRAPGLAENIYSALEPGDFSRQVLSMSTGRLIALRMPGAGWSDLGNPQRVAAAAMNHTFDAA